MAPLAADLNNVPMSHSCPYCGHELQRTGGWFKTVGSYLCEACKRPVRLTHDDKVKLFGRYSTQGDLIRRTGSRGWSVLS